MAVTVITVVALQPVIVLVKVSIAVPAETPVARPEAVTVATGRLPLDQVPPVVGDSVIVLPTLIEDVAETTGKALIVATTAILAAVVHPPDIAST